MSTQLVIDVGIGVAMLAFVVIGLFSLSTISVTRFAGAMAVLAFFFVAVWIRTIAEGGGVRLAPLLLFVWLWCFTFYYLGLRCVARRGILARTPFDPLAAAASSPSNSAKLVTVLRWWRHLIIWPIVVVVAFVVVRGLAGFGWVTTISW